MSIFQTTEADTNQGEATQTNESFLAKIVEARGEQWKDPEVLAKGKLEADKFIAELQAQVKELREDLNKQEYSKELLNRLQDKAAFTSANSVAPNKDNDGGAINGQTNAALSEDDLKRLVESTLSQREQASTAKQNLAYVEEELSKRYGTEAQATLAKKSQELGISVKRMAELAQESPSAFMALLGEKAVQPRMLTGSIRTEGVNMQAQAKRDFEYYNKLRKENRKLYFSPEVRQQMMKDRESLGDKFY